MTLAYANLSAGDIRNAIENRAFDNHKGRTEIVSTKRAREHSAARLEGAQRFGILSGSSTAQVDAGTARLVPHPHYPIRNEVEWHPATREKPLRNPLGSDKNSFYASKYGRRIEANPLDTPRQVTLAAMIEARNPRVAVSEEDLATRYMLRERVVDDHISQTNTEAHAEYLRSENLQEGQYALNRETMLAQSHADGVNEGHYTHQMAPATVAQPVVPPPSMDLSFQPPLTAPSQPSDNRPREIPQYEAFITSAAEETKTPSTPVQEQERVKRSYAESPNPYFDAERTTFRGSKVLGYYYQENSGRNPSVQNFLAQNAFKTGSDRFEKGLDGGKWGIADARVAAIKNTEIQAQLKALDVRKRDTPQGTVEHHELSTKKRELLQDYYANAFALELFEKEVEPPPPPSSAMTRAKKVLASQENKKKKSAEDVAREAEEAQSKTRAIKKQRHAKNIPDFGL